MARANGNGITPKQQRAIEALMTERTITGAAQVAKVSRRTLTSWLADEQFCAVLSKAADDALAIASRQLAALSVDAVATLRETMGPTAKPATRQRAADIVLGRVLAVRAQVEVESRLSALERKVDGNSTASRQADADRAEDRAGS